MRPILLAWVGVMALGAVANANERPGKSFAWGGLYAGLHFGLGWGTKPIENGSTAYAPLLGNLIPTEIAGDPHGVIGGAQAGANWQWGSTVFGVETDISASGLTGKDRALLGFSPAMMTEGEQRLQWFGTTRGRVGYASGDGMLFYGTGGVAYGHGRVSMSSVINTGGSCAVPGTCVSGSNSKALFGWTVGAGWEYAFDRWSVRIEYLHYDLGRVEATVFDPATPTATITSGVRFSGEIIRGGLNYRFFTGM